MSFAKEQLKTNSRAYTGIDFGNDGKMGVERFPYFTDSKVKCRPRRQDTSSNLVGRVTLFSRRQVCLSLQHNPGERLGDALPPLAARHAQEAGQHLKVLACRQSVEQRELLGH